MNKFFRVNSYSFKSIFCFIFFISLLNAEIISAQSTNCSNSNFENGDFSNWQGGTGTPNGNSGNNPGGCCAIVINNFLNSGALLPPRHTITTPSFDPNTLNNLPEVAPGGNFSARIGSWQNSFYQQNNPGPFPGSKSEMLKYTFTVTPNSELFVYKYAVVLEDPDTNVNYHAQNEKPRFEIKVLDANGNYVPNAQCGHYLVTADSNQTGFEQGITTPASVVHYRNWTTVGIDLTAYLGQSITILFQVGDCALGGHFGYAYIDAYCQPLQVLTQYCVGQNQVILTAPPGFSYHWMPGGDTTQTITLNNPVNGSVYTCDLISVTGCVATISTVVQPTSMVPNFNYQVDCNLNTALFADATTIQNGTISNWAWDFGDGSPIMNGVQNPVHTYPGPGSYTVTLTLTTNSGCTSTVTLPVTIPLVAVNAPLSTICSASSVTLTASGGTTYSWTPSIGLSASTGATVAASPTVNTTYTVTVYNANGCSGTTTAVVTIAPNLLVNISAVTDSVCVGHTTTLTAIGGNNYTWSPTLGLSASTGSTVTAHPTSNTTYTVSVSNTAGCTGQASIPIALIPNPGIAVSSQAICAGQSATLNVLGANTYQWSNGSTGGAITVSPVANTSYTVIGFVGACTDTATGIVIVSPLPILNATSSGNICLNGTVTLNANGATNYTWTPSVGFSSSSGSTIVGSPTSNATYTVTGTDLNGCTALTTVNVVVHNPPVIVASASPSILCVGSSTMLTASGTQNYYWSPSTGLAATTGNSILAFPPASTTYTVIGIDTFGCADTVAVPVTISPGPTLNISASNSTICFGANANLNATGANTYSWSPSTGLNVSTGATVTASPAVSTTYFVTAMDSLGCVANAISTVTVNPLPVMTSSATGLICGNGSAQLTATGANTYAWSPSTGLSATTGNNISATISSTTTYTVTGTNLNGCTANSSVTVTVHPIPVIAATPSSAILCTSSSASLTASGGVNYFWSPSTGLSATTGNPIQATPLASSTYSVIGFDANGCSSSSTVSLVVSAGPPLNLVTANPVICIGDSTTLNASGGTNYTWSPSSGLSISTGATVTATPTSTTTYLVSTTDTSGCVASAISIVTVNPLPVLSVVAANPTICFGEATSLTASGANAYAWTPAADLSASTGSTVSANPSVTTTYTIVGSNTFGCTSSIQIIVTVNPLPVLNVIANNPVICFGETTTLNASGAQFYNWSPSNNLSASTGSTVQASPHNSTIFTIIGTDINGCSSATSNSVTVNPLPNLNVTSTDTVLCNLSSATLTATGAAVYTWSPSTGLSASTGNIVQATPSAAITYTVTGTSLFGCIDSTTINIHVNPLPVISVTSSNPAYCPGGSSIITASGANIYNWSPSLGLSATTGDTVIANPSATSVYSVTAIDTNGCSVVSISTVTVNPLPVITPSTSPTICLNQSSILTASGATTYQWSPSTGLNVSTGNTVTASPTTSTTYSITGTDLNGCSSSVTLPVTVNPLPTIISSSATPTVCLNSSTTLTASGASTYSWSPSTALSSTTGNAVTSTPLTPITYTVTGIDINGCSANSSVNVGVNPLPTVTSAGAAICFGFSTPLTASGANTYAWSPNTNLSATVGATVTASPTSSIVYSILGTDLNGCTGTATSTVTVNPLPVITPSASPTICLNQSSILTASGATTYDWSPSIGLNVSTGNIVTASPSASIIYSITGTDLNGCSSSVTLPVTVNPLPTIISSTSTPKVCLNSSTTLTASGASTYSWSPSTALSGTTGNSVTSTPLIPITYTVTGIDVNGCSANSSVNVGVNPLPTVTSADAAICFGFSTPLTASGANTYAWSPNTNLSSTVGTTVTANPTSTIVYSILGTDLNGCTGTATSTVTVNPLPIITPSASPTICLNQSCILTASGATTYDWSPSTGLNVSTGNTVTASPTASTTYSITGTDLNGCSSSVSLPVTVNPLPTIISTTSTPAVCLNSSTTLTASGASTYSWSPSTALSGTIGNSVTSTPLTPITYTVIGIDVNGCSANSSVNVGVNALPTVTTADAAVCFGFSTPLTASGANTYAWSPNTNLSSTIGATVTANPTATIVYSILGTDLNGCTGTTTSTVTVNPLPVITPSASPTICLNQSSILTASGATTYNWSPGTGLNVTTGNTVTASPTASTTYTITGTDLNGCSSSVTLPVTVNPLPTIISSSATPTVCLNSSTTLTASGVSTYSWSPSTALSSTTGNAVTSTPLTPITYTVTGIDVNGCSANSSVNVGVNALPTVTTADAAICFGFSTPLTASGANTYAWSPNTNLSSTIGATVTANPTATIVYSILGTNLNGCTGTTTSTVTVNPLPVITVSSIDSVLCTGESTELIAAGGTTYNWSPSVGLNASTGNTVSANPTSSTTYTVVGFSAFGCQSSTSIPVTVNPLPSVTVINNPFICPGDFATLIATGALNYHWSTNALGSTISVNPVVNTTYSVVGTDANNCSASDTALVSINPVPVISAVAQQSTLCIGQSTSITASGAVTYTWLPSTGLNSTTGSTVIANPFTTSTYTIVGTNVTGCMDTTTITITINALPVAAAGPDENICIGNSVQLNASGGTTYSWSPGALLNNSNIANPLASPTTTTTFIVVVGNQFNCYSNDTLEVIVHPLPNVDAGPSQVVCYPSSTQLHGNGALSYSWMPLLYLNDSLIQNPICTPQDNITYTLTASDNFGCVASDTVSVKVMKPFQIVANPDEMMCYNSQVQLSVSGGYNYLWSPMTGLDNPYISNPIASPSFTTTYIVYSSDGVCFSASDTVVVTVNQLPLIYAGADAEILYGQSYQLYGYSSSGGSVQWSPADFLSCTDCPDPMVVHINIPMTYTLTVTDSLGCKAEDYVSIHLACSDDMVYVPDAFTPNGDGKNDIFRVRTYALSHITAFRVFNRWGEMVFETYDVSKGWDGTWQGQKCTPAVYVWYIEGNCADGSEVKKKGNVTLIR